MWLIPLVNMQTWYKILIEKGTLYGLYFSSFYLMSKPNQSTCPFGLHFGFMHLGLAFYLFIGIIWFAFWIHASASGFFFFFWHFGFMRLASFLTSAFCTVLHCSWNMGIKINKYCPVSVNNNQKLFFYYLLFLIK